MRKRTHIAPVEAEPLAASGSEGDEPDVLDLSNAVFVEEVEDDAGDDVSGRSWAVPAAAVALVLGWTAFFAWVHQEEMLAGAPAARWVEWIGAWTAPVLLVIGCWLLAMRTSRREAARFADAGHALAREADRLEERLTAVNRELSLAREFLAAEARDLESLGRQAGERLSEHADRLKSLVSDNGAQVEAIAGVSTTALENMQRLRGDLPVIANAARDVANQIGNTGRTAQKQLETMIEGMDRLNHFGKASEQQVLLVRQRVDDALAAFEAQAKTMELLADGRFARLSEASDSLKIALEGHEAEALAAIRQRTEALFEQLRSQRETLAQQESESLEAVRRRIAVLRDEAGILTSQIVADEDRAMEGLRTRLDAVIAQVAQFETGLTERDTDYQAQLAARQEAANQREDDQLRRMEARLARFDAQAIALGQSQQGVADGLAEQAAQLASRLAELQAEVASISAQGATVREGLAEGMRKLNDGIAEGRQSIHGTERQVAALTDASVRLLELINASARHSEETLPTALADAEGKLLSFRAQSEDMAKVLAEATDAGRQLAEQVAGTRTEGQSVIAEFERFHERLAGHNREHVDRIAELRSQLSDLAKENEERASEARDGLSHAIASLQASISETLDQLSAGSDTVVGTMAADIAEKSAQSIDRALEGHAEIAVGKLEAAASRAARMGHDTAIQLRDQLARVDELASNLEARVAHARQRAEEQVDNDFARRVALITESLNSHAIDIAKALSNEVTDTAWASYLKGDRGIFTRRAVRLMETSESRAISDIYEADADFREHVSRYVHDFEAMMRTLLSTRDGHALSVTLLSSDMGKLYVILAQAIDRLRD